MSEKETRPTDEPLDAIVRRILDVSDPESIILFGSRARGDARADSDYDLLVIERVAASPRAVAQKIDRALAELGVAVDVVVVTEEYVRRYGKLVGSVVRPALHDGKVLYAKAS